MGDSVRSRTGSGSSPLRLSPVMGVSALQQQQQQQQQWSPTAPPVALQQPRPRRAVPAVTVPAAPVAGILRVDCSRPRRSSASSFGDGRSPRDRLGSFAVPGEPASPQPSVDRLSVTFAPEEPLSPRGQRSPPPPHRAMSAADKVRFSRTPSALTDGEDDEGDEEDYSASVSAIMQRRASSRRLSRRSRRRPSSPFSPDADSGLSAGRRTSVFTTSSGDSAVSLEEGGGGGGGGGSSGGGGAGASTQEQIYENLRLHKEVLGSVKQQPWPMRRKLRLVQQAKAYVRRHEGALRERLAQSRTTKDMLSRCHLLLVKRWQYMRRELANLVNVLIPWELRIKEIESHFGSVVASYFTFLRWLFWVNLVIAVLLAAFVAIPEMLTADPDSAGGRKRMPASEQSKATRLVTLWNFDGVLKYSPFFYGYYTNHDGTRKGYRLPFAYFMTGLAVYVYSFVATLRRMAENSRMSKLSEKDDECVFTWKLFSGWDYMIGNPETAHNRVASIILGFKEALLEEAERRRDARNWKVIGLRVLVNLAVLLLLVSSAYAVVEVVNRSKEPGANASWWRQNEITVVLSLISFVFPILFELLGLLEHYHPRKQLRVQLARIMVLNLLNLYTLIFALFGKIAAMTHELELLRGNLSTTAAPVTLAADPGTTASADDPAPPHELCVVPVPCGGDAFAAAAAAAATTTTAAAAAIAAALRVAPAALRRHAAAPASTTDWPRDDVESDIRSAPFEASATGGYADYDAWADREFNATPSANASTIFYSSTYTDYTSTDPNVTSTTENDSSTPSTTLQFINDTARTSLLSSTSTDMTPPFQSDFEGDGYEYEYSTESQTLMTEMANSVSSTTLSELCTQIVPCVNGSVYVETTTAALQTTTHEASVTSAKTCMDDAMQKKLSQLCWETMFGQELVKLTVMDLIITIISTLIMDFFRAIFVRVMNHCWCWDLEKQFPQYGDFKIAENILHLVNNQGMVWMGMFFCPGLPLLNLVKLAVLMYLRSWAVLTCNVPHEVVFRASRSNNFYLALLLTMLFLCVLPVGYAIVWVNPSWHCGPFSGYQRIYMLFTQSVRGALPAYLHRALDYAASPGIVIPLLVLLVLIIYYLLSLTSALREANNDLKVQLRRERTEERRKVFQLAEGRRCGEAEGAAAGTPFARWRKILPVMPVSSKASPAPGATPQPGADAAAAAAALGNGTAKADATRNELLARLMRRALRKSSAESEDDAALVALHAAGPDDALTGPGETPPPASSTATATATAAEARRRSVLASPSTGSYRERNDSLASGWSDTIPVIRISKTDSSECMLQRAEPQRPVTALPDEGAAAGSGNDAQTGETGTAGAAPVHRAARSRGRREGDVPGESVPLVDLQPADTDSAQVNQAFQQGLSTDATEDPPSFNYNSQL